MRRGARLHNAAAQRAVDLARGCGCGRMGTGCRVILCRCHGAWRFTVLIHVSAHQSSAAL